MSTLGDPGRINIRYKVSTLRIRVSSIRRTTPGVSVTLRSEG